MNYTSHHKIVAYLKEGKSDCLSTDERWYYQTVFYLDKKNVLREKKSDRPMILENELSAVLSRAHITDTGFHLNKSDTCKQINTHFVPNLGSVVEKFIENCEFCQLYHPETYKGSSLKGKRKNFQNDEVPMKQQRATDDFYLSSVKEEPLDSVSERRESADIAEKEKLQSDINLSNKSIATLTEQLRIANETIQYQTTIIDNKEAKIALQKEEISSLTETVQELTAKLQREEGKVSENSETVDQLKQSETNAREIEILQLKISVSSKTHDMETKRLLNQIVALRANNQRLFDENRESNSEKQRLAQELISQREANDKEVDDLRTQLQANTVELQNNQEKFDSLCSTSSQFFKNLKIAIDAKEAETQKMREQFAMERDAAVLQSRAEINDLIANRDSRLHAKQDELDAKDAKLANLKIANLLLKNEIAKLHFVLSS